MDGTARNLADAASIEGTLAARISTAGFTVNQPETQGAQPAETKDKAHGFFDVTAKLSSEPGRVKMDDIAISIEQGGLPQLISAGLPSTGRTR